MIQKPLATPLILKKEHPWVKDLVACYVMNDYGCKSVSDLYSLNNSLSLTNTTWVQDGIEIKNNGEFGIFNNSNQLINSTCGTILLYFKALTPFNEVVKRSYFGNSTSGIGQFIIYKNTGNELIFLFQDNIGVHWIKNNSSYFPSWTDGFQLGILWDKNTVIGGYNLSFSVNGINIAPHQASSAYSWNTFTIYSNLGILNNIDGLTNSNAICKYMYIFNTTLSENKQKLFFQNPFDIFYSQEEIYSSFLMNFAGFLPLSQNKIFGANAFPIGQGV